MPDKHTQGDVNNNIKSIYGSCKNCRWVGNNASDYKKGGIITCDCFNGYNNRWNNNASMTLEPCTKKFHVSNQAGTMRNDGCKN